MLGVLAVIVTCHGYERHCGTIFSFHQVSHLQQFGFHDGRRCPFPDGIPVEHQLPRAAIVERYFSPVCLANFFQGLRAVSDHVPGMGEIVIAIVSNFVQPGLSKPIRVLSYCVAGYAG